MTEAPEVASKRPSSLEKRAAKPRAAPTVKSVSGNPATKTRSRDYLGLYRAAPLDRIKMVKEGVPAIDAKGILGDLAMPSGRIYGALRIPVSTLNRKAKSAMRLSTDEGERIIGLAKLVGQVQAMVEESGNPKDFDARAWTARWLNEPLPAFGGARPVDLMDTMEGQGLVSDTLARIQSGVYA